MVFKHSTIIFIELLTLGSYQVEEISELHNDIAEVASAEIVALGVAVDIA
jgi:hypothetical protein